MFKNIGLWIDHKKAVMVILDDKGEEIKLIQSGMNTQELFRGGMHMKTTHAAQYFPAEDHKDRRIMEKLNKFYVEVISSIRNADSVLIFGPGEAKFELEKRMEREKATLRIAAIETADKMTDRQIAAKVRSYFKK